jgi:hypothetical protein
MFSKNGKTAQWAVLIALAVNFNFNTRGADATSLFGIHWWGVTADQNGNPTVPIDTAPMTMLGVGSGGWSAWDTESILTHSDWWWGAQHFSGLYSQLRAWNVTPITRIDYKWEDTVPAPGDPNYAGWPVSVRNAVNTLAPWGHIWLLGNEPNLQMGSGTLWPNGQVTPAAYAAIYRNVRNEIRANANGSPQGAHVLLVAAPSPGGIIPGVRWMAGTDWLSQVLDNIPTNEVDGIALHAYAGDINTFRNDYQTQLAVIDAHGLGSKPVWITEFNRGTDTANTADEATTAQFVRDSFADINTWNGGAGHHNIVGLTWFVYDSNQQAGGGWNTYAVEYWKGVGYPAGDSRDIYTAFQQAVAFHYPAGAWGGGSQPPSCWGIGPGNPTGSNLSLTATYYIESGRNQTDQYGRYALDGVSTTKWCANTANSGGSGTLAVDLGASSTVTGFILRHAQWGGEANYLNTKRFRVESATSMFGPWTTEWDVNNDCQDQYNRFVYGTAKTLRYLRLVITNPGIDSFIRLPEFEIWGTRAIRDTIEIHTPDYAGGVNAAAGSEFSDTTAGNSGGAYRSQDVDIESSTDGRYNVGWTAAGEWLNYPIQGQGSGLYTLYIRYASPYAGKSMHLNLNGAALTGAFTLNNTGGWQTWQTLTVGNVNIGTGWKTISINCDTDGFNVHRFWLVPATSAPTINRSPATLSASATQGSNPANQTFTVANSGGGTLNYTITDNAGWMNESPASGTSTGGANTHTVTYSATTLAVGSYSGTITISDANASNNPQTIPVTLMINKATVTENFNAVPSWSSSFDAAWGGAASWSVVSGGQSGNALQASRSNTGSSAKVKVYSITTNVSYTISIYIKCPSSTAYWAECAFKLGNNTAQDFDANAATWTYIKKFSDTGVNGNGNVWTLYSVTFNSGANTQVSVGYKLGSSSGNGPIVGWDTLRIQ